MDFNPTAKPIRLATGDIHIHACIYFSLSAHSVRA